MRNLNGILWSFSTKKFIPHGSTEDNDPEKQPILLSTSTEERYNNPSTILLLTPINVESAGNFNKYIYMFNGNESDSQVLAMNNLYDTYKQSNSSVLKYWFLDASKKWSSRYE